MISRVDVTVPIPSIPMPAWAHQWLMIILGLATVVATSVSVWGPGLGMSLHVIALTASGAASVATLFRAIDAASETIVKNADLATTQSGAIAVTSTTNRKAVLTNAVLPQQTEQQPAAVYAVTSTAVPPAPETGG